MTRRRWNATLGFVLLLAMLEWLWLGWFLTTPLPNAAAVGARLSRADLLWQSLPELVPGVTWNESHLGIAVENLSHVENLPQRVPILLAAGLIAMAALALGSRILALLRADDGGWTLSERIPIAFALGMSTLGGLTLLFGRFGLLTPWSVRLGLGFMAIAGMAPAIRRSRPEIRLLGSATKVETPRSDRSAAPAQPLAPNRWAWITAILVVSPFLLLMLLGAMLPTIEFDALEYHLQGPKEYFQQGRIHFLPHNVYTSMPFSVEMLHLLGMWVLNDWWSGALVGQVLVMLHLPAAGLMIAASARRWGSVRAAWVAAVVFLTTPWVVRLAVTPFVEGPLCLYHAALIWIAASSGHRSELEATGGPHRLSPLVFLSGLLAGGAMGCKYPGLISAVVPFGLLAAGLAVRRRSWRVVLAYLAGVALLAGPWLVKNIFDTGNPVYPLASGVFGNRVWDAILESRWTRAHGPRAVAFDALWRDLIDVAGRSDWQSPLFLALAPLALLKPGTRKPAIWLWSYALYLFATWWLFTHRVDRFWIPILPVLAILAGLGADWSAGRPWSILLGFVVGIGVASNLAFVSTDLAGSTRWTDDLNTLREETPAFVNPSMARLDATLPTGAKVLMVGQAAVFPMRHSVLYNTVFDRETLEQIVRDRTSETIRRDLHDRGITHIYVDWAEIERYRRPGNYGYSDFVTPELLGRLVESGLLEPPDRLGPKHELYRVR